MAAAGPPPLAVEAEGPPILITLGTEAYRRSFRYNDAGRIIESKGHFFGRRTDYSAMTCNHRGDILTLTTDDKPLNCFEYEYDEHENWIRKIVRYAQSSREETRLITYY